MTDSCTSYFVGIVNLQLFYKQKILEKQIYDGRYDDYSTQEHNFMLFFYSQDLRIEIQRC